MCIKQLLTAIIFLSAFSGTLSAQENIQATDTPQLTYLLFKFAGSSYNGRDVDSKAVSNFFLTNSECVKSITSYSKCCNGRTDFYLGNETTGGKLEFKLQTDYVANVSSVDIFAIQFTNSAGIPCEATLSFNDSDPVEITDRVDGISRSTTADYGCYTFPVDPSTPLSTIKLESSKRVRIYRMDFNLANTSSIDRIDAEQEATEEYYDLNGTKIDSNHLQPGHIYIVRRGSHASKIVVTN